MTLIQQLKHHLINQNLKINSPVTLLQVEQFERKYHIKFPEVLKEYFLIFNGTGEANFGDEGFSFFSLDEFRPVQNFKSLEGFKIKNCFVFSEYLLWVSGYAIQLDLNGNDLGVYEICNLQEKVCDGFEEFIRKVIQNSDIST